MLLSRGWLHFSKQVSNWSKIFWKFSSFHTRAFSTAQAGIPFDSNWHFIYCYTPSQFHSSHLPHKYFFVNSYYCCSTVTNGCVYVPFYHNTEIKQTTLQQGHFHAMIVYMWISIISYPMSSSTTHTYMWESILFFFCTKNWELNTGNENSTPLCTLLNVLLVHNRTLTLQFHLERKSPPIKR